MTPGSITLSAVQCYLLTPHSAPPSISCLLHAFKNPEPSSLFSAQLVTYCLLFLWLTHLRSQGCTQTQVVYPSTPQPQCYLPASDHHCTSDTQQDLHSVPIPCHPHKTLGLSLLHPHPPMPTPLGHSVSTQTHCTSQIFKHYST
jgi:hypothetical protein